MAILAETEILQESDIKLLGQRLLDKAVIGHVRLGKGRNSRCYQLQCVDEKSYVLKFYFQSTNDLRDRLGVEFKTLSFLWNNGVRCVPQAIIMDRVTKSAVYQHIAGTWLGTGDLGVDDINELVRFLDKINQLRANPEALEFGPASEACFSICGVIESIENRLARFDQVIATDKTLADFLNLEFKPLFVAVQKWVKKTAAGHHIEIRQELGKSERILSPSDVGFHNALKERGGEIVFLDFEYFGWDDPTKLIVDFVLHPAMDLADSLKTHYMQKVLQLFPEQKMLKARAGLVYPLFGLKWCLILLNEFLDDFRRRRFAAQGGYDPALIKRQQLEKARKMHQKIKSSYQRGPYLP